MGLFNRKQKTQEIKDDFNYEEMMKKAKMVYSNTTLAKIPTDTSSEDSKDLYWKKIANLLKGSQFSYVRKTSTNSDDINKKYKSTIDETNYVGVYNKNNKLLLTFEIDLDKLYLYRYLINYTEFSNCLDKVDIQPISNIELNKELSNYSIKDTLIGCLTEDVLTGCIYICEFPHGDVITNDYITKSILMYINNLNKTK